MSAERSSGVRNLKSTHGLRSASRVLAESCAARQRGRAEVFSHGYWAVQAGGFPTKGRT